MIKKKYLLITFILVIIFQTLIYTNNKTKGHFGVPKVILSKNENNIINFKLFISI